MNRQPGFSGQPHPVQHPPLEAPPNDLEIVWIDETPQSTWIDSGVITTVSMVTLGAAVLLVMPIVAMPAIGATRSTRLRWAARQAEIEQALAEQQAYLQGREHGMASEQPADVDRQE